MEAVNVSGLKNNPSEALRKAQGDLVVVMNRDRPDAFMVGVDSINVMGAPGVKLALATALFKDGNLSLVRSARLAALSIPEFVAHVSRLGIPAIRLSAQEAAKDMDTLDAWLATS